MFVLIVTLLMIQDESVGECEKAFGLFRSIEDALYFLHERNYVNREEYVTHCVLKVQPTK